MKRDADRTDPESRETRRVCTDDGGFALTWFAILLIVLIAMAGFGVDVWNWWYTSQKVQRAADAGALAGVTFLPANFRRPAAGPNAVTTATAAIKQNGFVAGAKTTVTVAPGSKSNQLDVTVAQTVDNIFTSLLGVRTTTISRKATAEFNAPIQMGSPAGHLGNDPENGATDKHWLNIGAPNVDKHTGDRYADYHELHGVRTGAAAAAQHRVLRRHVHLHRRRPAFGRGAEHRPPGVRPRVRRRATDVQQPVAVRAPRSRR